MTDLPDEWEAFKREQPKTALALSVLPVTGQLAAAAEYWHAVRRGDTMGGIEAALQFIPGVAIAKKGKAAYRAGEAAMDAARAKIFAGTSSGAIYGAEKAAGKATRAQGAATTGMGVIAEGASNAGNIADYNESQGNP